MSEPTAAEKLEALRAEQLLKHPPHKCQYWLPHKRKFCNFAANARSAGFCGNHLALGLAAAGLELPQEDNTKKRRRKPSIQRVPCPIDPRHTVAIDQLSTHVAFKCPALARMAQTTAASHFHQDINVGSDDDVELRPAPVSSDQGASEASSSPFAPGRAALRQAAARRMGQEQFMAFVQRVQAAYQQECGDLPPFQELKPACLEGLLAEQEDTAAAKHTRQAASIVGQLMHLGLLPLTQARDAHNTAAVEDQPGVAPAAASSVLHSTDITAAGYGPGVVVELGAGKGTLSRAVVAAPQQLTHVTGVVLVDNRAAFRGKADRHMRHLQLERITLDLKDMELNKLDMLQPAGACPQDQPAAPTDGGTQASPSQPPAVPQPHPGSSAPDQQQQQPRWLVIAKHLCGAATDFSLRTTLRCVVPGADHPGSPAAGAQGPDEGCSAGAGLRGLAIATCCHHRCGWKSYVGKRMFRRLGFSPMEFEILSWMTGWALCGHDCAPGQAQDEADEGQEEQGKEQEQHTGDWDPSKGLARPLKMQIGAMAKLLIDRGRLLWVCDRLGLPGPQGGGQWLTPAGVGGESGLPHPVGSRFAGMLRYIDDSVSGENKLLVAGV